MSAPLIVPPGLCGVGGCVFIEGHAEYALTGAVHSWGVTPVARVVSDCEECGGCGIVGSPPDAFFDCPSCIGGPVDIQDTKGWPEP